jgi:putative salt-induced outer membrane protein YdiY
MSIRVPAAARRMLLGILLVLIAPARIALGQAPAPPVQTPAPPPEPPPRLEASAQFTFVGTQGNASSQSLGVGGDLIWRPDPWTYSAKAIFAQSESDEELTARSLAATFRAARALNERWLGYSQYDFLRDRFAGVEQRHVIEGGLSYLALREAPHRLRLDMGLGYLYERQPDEHFDSATLSLGAAYRFLIAAASEFTYEPRFLLPFVETDAWKFNQDAALTVALTTILSLKVAHTVRYSAEPPPGFETTDTIMAVSLVAKVRRPK